MAMLIAAVACVAVLAQSVDGCVCRATSGEEPMFNATLLQRATGQAYHFMAKDRDGAPRFDGWFNFCGALGDVPPTGRGVCKPNDSGCVTVTDKGRDFVMGNGGHSTCSWKTVPDENNAQLVWYFTGADALKDATLVLSIVCDWDAWPAEATRIEDDASGSRLPPIGVQSWVMYSRCGCHGGPCDLEAVRAAGLM